MLCHNCTQHIYVSVHFYILDIHSITIPKHKALSGGHMKAKTFIFS